MTRIALAVLLLFATAGLGFGQIHCWLEESESAEPCCELCHLSGETPLSTPPLELSRPEAARALLVLQNRIAPPEPISRLLCDRGPPR